MNKQIKQIIYTAVLMIVGLLLFKFIPMQLYGKDILFDASMHVIIAMFILYFFYFFIDQNKSWRIPYFIFCAFILTIISVQRITTNAHSDVGLLIGFIISIISIILPRYKEFRRKIKW